MLLDASLGLDTLARVLGGARELEGLGAVEGGRQADFADLVRVDLIIRIGRQRWECRHASISGSPYTAEGSLGGGRGLSRGLLCACDMLALCLGGIQRIAEEQGLGSNTCDEEIFVVLICRNSKYLHCRAFTVFLHPELSRRTLVVLGGHFEVVGCQSRRCCKFDKVRSFDVKRPGAVRVSFGSITAQSCRLLHFLCQDFVASISIFLGDKYSEFMQLRLEEKQLI